MISGVVSGLHALVPLLLIGPNGQVQIEFVLDTGFVGFLTLPPAIVAALGLEFISPQPVTLADGTRAILAAYRVRVIWDGAERETEVLEMTGAPLLGMSLLAGSDVRFQVADGGLVTIEPI